uniref:FLYWCH-type domain-containing protein n=1 Tax=Anopheles maculatus TaxID=74869 RepID=A0A182SQT0_9DIPT
MEKKIQRKEYWRCIYYTTKIKCHGRLHRDDNKVRYMGAHNHAPKLFKRADYKRLSEIVGLSEEKAATVVVDQQMAETLKTNSSITVKHEPHSSWIVVEKSVLQYTTTQRGRTMLIFSGYKFVENRQSKRNIFWRCARYVKHGCRAACVTSKNSAGAQSIRLTGLAHSHPPEDIRSTRTSEQSPIVVSLKLIYDRYEYIKDREFPLSTNWRCALFKRYNCRARAITKILNGITYVRLTNHGHNHSHKEYRKAQKMVYYTRMKE